MNSFEALFKNIFGINSFGNDQIHIDYETAQRIWEYSESNAKATVLLIDFESEINRGCS